MQIWPNFFIGGAPKAGTTSMYMYLRNIDGVFLSPIKEPHYFAPNTPSYPLLKHIREEKKYLKLFKGVKNEIMIGEASADYLRDPDSPKLIKEAINQPKFIFILRNPISRAFSHYLQNVRAGVEENSFTDALEICKEIDSKKNPDQKPLYLDAGLYYEQLERYLKYFDSDQILIIFFEEFIKDVKGTLETVLKFLDIKSNIPDFKEEAFNPYNVPKNKLSKILMTNRIIGSIVKKYVPESITLSLRVKYFEKQIEKPKMSQQDKKFLKKYYSDDVAKLKKMLKRDISWEDFKTE